MLVLVRNVSFDEDNPVTWVHNASFFISDASGDGEIRTPNAAGALDYFGTDVPVTPKDIIAVVSQRNEDTRLLPRSLADFMEPATSITEPGQPKVVLFPNPANTAFTIKSDERIDLVRIFDLSGRLMLEERVAGHSITLNAGNLRTGIYVVQVFSNKQIIHHKLQIQQ
jgi:hypothetical protein